jgi:putative ABC transport system permease protein
MVAKNPTRIVGVLPPGFNFPNNSDIWIPREIVARLPSRTAHNWQVIGRLQDGATVDQARADISAVAKRLSQQYRLEEEDMSDITILPLKDALTTSIRPTLLVLFAVAGLLLLVAWANVTNLWLAHAEGRTGELAVRAALGASRWRLARQLLAETLLLSLLGAFLGILAAYFGIRVLVSLAPADIPRLDEVSVNVYVLLFALAVSILVAVSLGLFTALRSTWREAQTALIEGGQRQGTGIRSRRTGQVIVATQIAITLILLTGAGLLGRSLLRVLSIQPGFETEQITTLQLKAPDLSGRTETQRAQLIEQLITRLETLPGIQEVGGTNALPLKSAPPAGTFALVNSQQLSTAQRELIERSATISAEDPDPVFVNDLTKFTQELFRNKTQTGNADYVLASEGYFETLGIPLRGGRLFSDAAGPSMPHEAVISESVAQQTWANQDPIGKTIEFGNMDGDLRLLTIVGVVGEVRTILELEPRPTIYVNYRQRPRSLDLFDITMRNTSDPAVLVGAVREVLRQTDPTIPPRLTTFSEVFSESVNRRRFNTLLVGAFALTALLLAIAGVFGVLAYSVAQRTREIGLRIALGATPLNIVKMVLGQGLVTIGIGTAIGLLGSLLLTRTMRSLLFEVSPNDPLTVAGVTLLLILIAALASYLPAHRATRVDPMVALRRE